VPSPNESAPPIKAGPPPRVIFTRAFPVNRKSCKV
jgi:hypothetical protein